MSQLIGGIIGTGSGAGKITLVFKGVVDDDVGIGHPLSTEDSLNTGDSLNTEDSLGAGDVLGIGDSLGIEDPLGIEDSLDTEEPTMEEAIFSVRWRFCRGPSSSSERVITAPSFDEFVSASSSFSSDLITSLTL